MGLAFFGNRVQGPSDECFGRKADMSSRAARALRAAIGQMEAGYKLMSNCERVVQDLVNPGPNNIEGKTLTQTSLKRMDGKHKAVVEEMVKALGSRLLGLGVAGPHTPEEGLVWLEAATFLADRVQGSKSECAGRDADMSSNAAKAFKGVLAEFEAVGKLVSNRETVVKDLTNPGVVGVGGGSLTQRNLKRVAVVHYASVDAMIGELSNRILGRKVNAPSTSGEAGVWAEAAVCFNGRIQASADAFPGRAADMSPEAANALRTGLARVEAAYMLMSNRDRVVQDITNGGSSNIDGKKLTQTELKRVDNKHEVSVSAMIKEVSCRLLGKAPLSPSPQDASVWAEAAQYFGKRIQATAAEMPGRKPDMSAEAATALRAVLGQF